MFRLNLWPPRPFLGQPAASQAFGRYPMMDNSFLQNPLTSPALMVLASTAEASRDGSRLHSPACYPGQEKEMTAVPFTSSSFMFRQGDSFAPSLQVRPPHFVHPSLGLINPGGGGAFRPVPQECHDYQSAFTPAKRSKLDNSAASPDIKINEVFHIKEELSSPVSSIPDTHSETQSDVSDGVGRSTPDDGGRSLRKRKKTLPDGQIACPVCGLTIRKGELTSHLAQELDKLDKLTRGGRRSTSRDGTPLGKGKVQSTPSTSRRNCTSPSQSEHTVQSRYENYLRVRSNRTSRLAVRNRGRKKRSSDEASCPVCNDRLFGTPEELNIHVEQCLKKRGDVVDDDLDIEGNDNFEEYTWAGQTRIRATTLLEGGMKGSGFATATKVLEDEDVDLNVDDDESEQYGKSQYSEADIVPCNSDEDEAREREILRGAVLGSKPSLERTEPLECSKWSSQSTDENSEAVSSTDTTQIGSKDVSSSTTEIIESLRSKLKYQESECEKANRFKCLICMETYTAPLVSIQCWHVHCEECWLRTLGAKKLCPQCNMITSPGDLRKVYL